MKIDFISSISLIVSDFICPGDSFSRLECSYLFILFFDRNWFVFLTIVIFALAVSDCVGMFLMWSVEKFRS